jgi:hypothetical protein
MLLHPRPGIRRTVLIGASLALLILGSSLLALRAHGEQTASVIEVAGAVRAGSAPGLHLGQQGAELVRG